MKIELLVVWLVFMLNLGCQHLMIKAISMGQLLKCFMFLQITTASALVSQPHLIQAIVLLKK